MGKLVDECHGGPARDDRIRVQLLDHDAPVLDAAAGHDLQALEQCGGPQAAVGLHEPDHHVRAPVVPR